MNLLTTLRHSYKLLPDRFSKPATHVYNFCMQLTALQSATNPKDINALGKIVQKSEEKLAKSMKRNPYFKSLIAAITNQPDTFSDQDLVAHLKNWTRSPEEKNAHALK